MNIVTTLKVKEQLFISNVLQLLPLILGDDNSGRGFDNRAYDVDAGGKDE